MPVQNSTSARIWIATVEFPDHYEVSDDGRVRRTHVYRNRKNKPFLATELINSGYLAVKLTISRRLYHRLIHRLVAEAFIGPIPPKYEVNHKNGDKLDNRAGNLEIVTCRDNHLHAVEAGLHRIRGEDNPAARVTAVMVRAIRADYRTGLYSKCGLARRHGVSESLVRRILNRESWDWLADED